MDFGLPQLNRVAQVMADGEWRDLHQIAYLTGDPPASVSARLRDLRKERFGGHLVERQARGRVRGVHFYRVRLNGAVGDAHVIPVAP